VGNVHDVRPLYPKLFYHVKVLSALHGAFPVRFGHLQGKTVRVGRTIYSGNFWVRTFNTVADTSAAAERARAARARCRPRCKLIAGADLYDVILDMLRNQWAPQQISDTLKVMFPNQPEYQVSHETVYKTIYATPHGELCKELITCMRQGHTKRRPRAGGVDRRQQIPDLVSIHLRPPEVDERILSGDWEGDLIKGAFNRSAVGTLVERVPMCQRSCRLIISEDNHAPLFTGT
jgi:IS30 family transposase